MQTRQDDFVQVLNRYFATIDLKRLYFYSISLSLFIDCTFSNSKLISLLCNTIYLYLEIDAQIYRFKDSETSPDSFYDYSPSVRDNAVPLIIDNGEFFPHDTGFSKQPGDSRSSIGYLIICRQLFWS